MNDWVETPFLQCWQDNDYGWNSQNVTLRPTESRLDRTRNQEALYLMLAFTGHREIYRYSTERYARTTDVRDTNKN